MFWSPGNILAVQWAEYHLSRLGRQFSSSLMTGLLYSLTIWIFCVKSLFSILPVVLGFLPTDHLSINTVARTSHSNFHCSIF